MKRRILSLITAVTLLGAYALPLQTGAAEDSSGLVLAFPGAEGAGKYATGGRGGTVYHVTNLNDSGAGSFRDAVSASNRIVVFDVGGTINLKSDVVCKGNITIAGQTAPGGNGITLRNGKIGMGGDNIIVRFISSRPGEKGTESDYDAWGGNAGSNSIIDHCSIGWANDEQFGLYSNNMHQTIQYTIIGPSNCVSYHSKGAHGFGMMFGKGQNTWHHNLICHSLSRNFRGKVEKTNSMDFVNNVIYDWGYQTAYGTMGHINYVNNYLKGGPSTKGGYRFLNNSSGSGKENYKFYVEGNTLRKSDGSYYNSTVEPNNWIAVNGFDEATYRSYTPFKVEAVDGSDASVVSTAETAEEAFETVTNYAGAAINAESRTKIDAQVLEEAKTGTGSLTGGRDFSTVTDSTVLSAIKTYGIQQVNYDEYYPAAITKKTITDTDNDGMPDDWETERGLDPNDASDATDDYFGDGYNNIEYYINDLTIDAFPEGVVTRSQTTDELGPEFKMASADAKAIELAKTKITYASELTLPTTAPLNGSTISWSSSSSAITIKDNVITSVHNTAETQTAAIVASVTYTGESGSYTFKRTFNITIRPTTWIPTSALNGTAAGTKLMDGLYNVSDLTASTCDVTINCESFTAYASGTDNGTWTDGAATGTAFKYTASADGYLSAY
ncbi:MAG: immunoglobulin-like domain-containing protein, partial [Candidatus Ornithomonoglobus sp.]